MADYTDSETRITVFKFLYVNFITGVIVANVALLLKNRKNYAWTPPAWRYDIVPMLTGKCSECSAASSRKTTDDLLSYLTQLVAGCDLAAAICSVIAGVYLSCFGSGSDLSYVFGGRFVYVFLTTIYWSFVSPAIHSLSLIARCWILQLRTDIFENTSHLYTLIKIVWIATFSLISFFSYGCYDEDFCSPDGPVLIGSKWVLIVICMIVLPIMAWMCAVVSGIYGIWTSEPACEHSSPKPRTCCELNDWFLTNHQKFLNHDNRASTVSAEAKHVQIMTSRYSQCATEKAVSEQSDIDQTQYSAMTTERRFILQLTTISCLTTFPFALFSVCHAAPVIGTSDLFSGVIFDVFMWLVYLRVVIVSAVTYVWNSNTS